MKTILALLIAATIANARTPTIVARWGGPDVQLTIIATGQTWHESYDTFFEKCGKHHPSALGVKVVGSLPRNRPKAAASTAQRRAAPERDNGLPLPASVEGAQPAGSLLPPALPEQTTIAEVCRSMALGIPPRPQWIIDAENAAEPPPEPRRLAAAPPPPKTSQGQTVSITDSYDVRKRAIITASRMNELLGGVLAGHGQDFIDAGRRYGVCPVFLAGVAMHETGNGTSRIANNNLNVFGIYRDKKYVTFDSVGDCIDYSASLIGGKGYVKARTPKYTIASIQVKYCPIGSNDPGGLNKHWRGGVKKYMSSFFGPTLFVVASN